MIRWGRIGMRLWPVAALLFFWISLAIDDAWPFYPLPLVIGLVYLAATSVALYVSVALLILALDDPSLRRKRLVYVAAIAAALVTCLTVPSLSDVAAHAVATLLGVAALRILPRVTFVAFVLANGFTATYFGLVVLGVGLILLPTPVSSYVRELLPRRVGSTQ